MATTYTYTFDATTDGLRNQVRFLARDNRVGAMRVQDEEIDFVIGAEMNPYMAAARVVELASISATAASGVASKSVGGLSISYDSTEAAKRAAELRRRGATYQTPTTGGISVAESDALSADSDRPEPDASRGIHDNPQASSLDSSLTGRFS